MAGLGDVLGVTVVVCVVFVPRFEHWVAHVVGYGLTRAVETTVAHPVPQLAQVGAVRVVGDVGGLGDRVGVDGEHAGPTGQHGLGDVLAGGPLHAGDLEDCGRSAVGGR